MLFFFVVVVVVVFVVVFHFLIIVLPLVSLFLAVNFLISVVQLCVVAVF